jgi:hypothetical protein
MTKHRQFPERRVHFLDPFLVASEIAAPSGIDDKSSAKFPRGIIPMRDYSHAGFVSRYLLNLVFFPNVNPQSGSMSQEDFIKPRPLDLKGCGMLRKPAVSKNKPRAF